MIRMHPPSVPIPDRSHRRRLIAVFAAVLFVAALHILAPPHTEATPPQVLTIRSD